MVFLMVFDVICCSFVSRPSLSKLYIVLETNPLVFDILVSILLTLVTNLSHRVFLTISLSTTLISLFKSSEKLLVCLHQIYLLQILGQLNQILLLNQMYQRLLLFLDQLCLINRQIKSTFYYLYQNAHIVQENINSSGYMSLLSIQLLNELF